MNRCEFEEAILHAVQSGQFTSNLQSHLDRCEACQEARLVAIFFDTLPEMPLTDLQLPSPASIWWRGQMAQKRDLAERSVAAINIIQKVAGVLIVGLLGVLAVLWAPQLIESLSRVAYLSVATVLFLVGSVLVLYAWATERI